MCVEFTNVPLSVTTCLGASSLIYSSLFVLFISSFTFFIIMYFLVLSLFGVSVYVYVYVCVYAYVCA